MHYDYTQQVWVADTAAQVAAQQAAVLAEAAQQAAIAQAIAAQQAAAQASANWNAFMDWVALSWPFTPLTGSVAAGRAAGHVFFEYPGDPWATSAKAATPDEIMAKATSLNLSAGLNQDPDTDAITVAVGAY
jgi:hypothetical protein